MAVGAPDDALLSCAQEVDNESLLSVTATEKKTGGSNSRGGDSCYARMCMYTQSAT